MPKADPPALTSKQAKRLHLKSGKGFQFTASQERAAARRNQKDEFARKLREKEERIKTNKRKRDEKEDKEREAKKRLIKKGILPQDALLPHVSASQPRLSMFLRQPTKPTPEFLPPLPPREDDDDALKADQDNEEDTPVNDQRPTVDLAPMDDVESQEFFSTTPASKEEVAAGVQAGLSKEIAPRSTVSQIAKEQLPATTGMDRIDIEAQLGYPHSQTLLDFEIHEDPLLDSEQVSIVTPSPRKRKRDEGTFANPSKSGRSVLSEMSPAKILLRSQEKPDMTSAPSVPTQLLSPEQQGPTSSQLAQETFAMISTQDLADNFDFSPQKENTDPGRLIPSQQQLRGGDGKGNFLRQQSMAGPSNSVSAKKIDDVDEYSFDDSVFEGFMDVGKAADSDELKDLEDVDEFDDGLDDEDWAGLSIQKAKNTAVSTFGSPKKAKDMPTKTPSKSMLPPLRPSPVATLVQKFRQATPAKVLPASPLRDFQAPPASQNYSFNEDLETDMLALADEVDLAGPSISKMATMGRTLPWANRPANRDSHAIGADEVEMPESALKCDA